MNLDSRQTRRLYLAGTVAFPTPFPTSGGISFEDGSLLRSDNGEKENVAFVVVQEKTRTEQSTIRVVRKSDVVAMFCPGYWLDTDQGRVFRFFEGDSVYDLEQGEWFLGSDINAPEISTRLKLNTDQHNVDITRRDSGARGLAFVPENSPVITITVTECTQTAGAAHGMGEEAQVMEAKIGPMEPVISCIRPNP